MKGNHDGEHSGTGRERRPANRKLLTEENVLGLPYKRHQYQVWDGTHGRGSEHVQRGLSVMVLPSGTKSYRSTYYFPNSSKPHSRHLGRVGEMTLAEAREQCRLDRRNALNGIDPKGDQTKSDAYTALVEEYVKRVLIGAKGNVSHKETRRILLKDCKEWEHRSVATITAPEIQRLLEHVRDGDPEQSIKPRPYLANSLYGRLNTFFNWCAKPTIAKLKTSPMTGIDIPWNGAKARDYPWFRGSAADEVIRKLWKGADLMGGTEGAYLKVLLLTGKRKTAIAEMKWEQIDENWFWHAPQPAKAKTNKRLHAIPLPGLVQRILHPRKQSGFVFVGDDDGHLRVSGHGLQDRIREVSGVADFFQHGCRHIAETKMGEIKIPPHIRDMLFDHAPKRGAGAGYDHHHYRDEMLAALETWSDYVEKLVTPEGVRRVR